MHPASAAKTKTNLMNKILLPLVAGITLAVSANAGQPVVTSDKSYKNPAPAAECFRAHELQLDLFGLHGWTTQGNHDDGFGGGLGVNYFLTKHLGVGVDGSIRDADAEIWNASASLILRFPIENGGRCLAPYILGGGGVQTNSTTAGSFHAGGGLEYRLPAGFGLFAEGRYFWAGANDQVQARAGFRIVF